MAEGIDGQAGQRPESASKEHKESGLFSEFIDTIVEHKGAIATVVGVAAATGLIIVSRGKLKGLADDLLRSGRGAFSRTLSKADDVAPLTVKAGDEVLATGAKVGDEVLGATAKVGDDVATLTMKERVVEAAVTGGEETKPMLTAIKRAANGGQLNPDVGAYIPSNRTLQRELLTGGGTVRHLGTEVEGTSEISETAMRLRRMLKG